MVTFSLDQVAAVAAKQARPVKGASVTFWADLASWLRALILRIASITMTGLLHLRCIMKVNFGEICKPETV